MGVLIQQKWSLSNSLRSLFLAAMRLFDFDPRDHAKRWQAKAMKREKRLVVRVQRHFSS